MTDLPLSGHRSVRRRVSVGTRLSLAGLLFVALAATLSGCGVSTALGNAALAPLSVLPYTDVVFETNLQSAAEVGGSQSGLGGVSSVAANGGGFMTGGAPTSPSQVSEARGTGVSVYTAFNPVDGHCLGIVVLAPGSALPVLGESSPGSYDFWFGRTTATNCTASLFTTETAVPSGWAAGDPSSTGWPSP